MTSKLQIDETGNRYSKHKVLGCAGSKKTTVMSSVAQWLCECDCGARIVTVGTYLRSGRKKYCGRKCPLKDAPEKTAKESA